MKNIGFLLILAAFFITGCFSKPTIDSNEVIQSAEVLTYLELNVNQKDQMKYGARYYPQNWADGISFNPQEAFYVKTRIKHELLSQLCESENTAINERITNSPNSLYGRHGGRWIFYDSINMSIYETNKSMGHNILEINRNNNIDEIIIGPLPKKPSRMAIKIPSSKYYSENEIPEFKLK